MAEIPKTYDPSAVESKWYDHWLNRQFFVAEPRSAKPAYSIVIPPPNVTGMLTLGHVLNNTIQDVLARKARMEGKEVLWLPGTDHAGIATQTVVERNLIQQGLMQHRDKLGRERFIEQVWAWKHKHGSIIIEQLKRLGASCDWSRERFTMDEAYSRCVLRVFVELFRKGWIYRGARMVNWDPAARTALSDEEVEMKETAGNLWHIKYPLLDGAGCPKDDEFVVVATTRPETMLGDEAVAVNPNDERYLHLVGRRVLLPLQRKAIPIITDTLVDPEFGTGCVKVTPAHDPADYDIARRHNLPFTVVIGSDGAMTAAAGARFAGLDRFKARTAVVKALEEERLLLKTEAYVHNVGYSQRSQAPVEPCLSQQWFLRYPSVEPSIRAVEQGKLTFYPDRWVKTYLHWMRNLRDWCISRQLWWGHRIPVWYRKQAGSTAGQDVRRQAEISAACPDVHVDVEPPSDPENWEQDPDVLDTWFSSWLWPFATMGWPEQTDTLRKFYPTTDLVTGPDIIFFWVARMIMAGYEFMGAKPFARVYYTGIIRDRQGRKLSKSLGNSPDPLELIDRYGADALRFGIMRSAPLGQDLLYDEQHVELGRNFCNKLWNACRFRQMQGAPTSASINPAVLTSDDRWILLRLDAAVREINEAFAEYRFHGVTQVLYRLFWGEFCDWYLEASKAALQGPDPAWKANTLAVIDFVLSRMLRLFHPFLPFITEELWHDLGCNTSFAAGQGGDTIMFAPWPLPLEEPFKASCGLNSDLEQFVAAKYDLVVQGRNLRREGNVPSNRRVRFVFKPAQPWAEPEIRVLKVLLNAEPLTVDAGYQPPKGTPTVRSPLGELALPLEGLIDVEAEKARLDKELAKCQAEIDKVRQKLANPDFVQKVPPAVLDQHKRRLAEWAVKREQVHTALNRLAQ